MTIQDSIITNNGGHGVEIAGTSTNSIEDVTIRDTRITANGADGVRATHVTFLVIEGTGAAITNQSSVPSDSTLKTTLAKSVIADNASIGVRLGSTGGKNGAARATPTCCAVAA